MQDISKAEEAARRLLELTVNLGRRHPLRDPLAQAIEEMALTPAQFHALMWLGIDGPLHMGELARRLGVTDRTVTGIVDRIEKTGMACRQRVAADRRVVEARLTEQGLELWKSLDQQIVGRTTLLLSALSQDDRDTLLRIVENLFARLMEARIE